MPFEMTWAEALPWVIAAAATVYLPGLVILAAARLPVLATLAAAPVVGVAVISGSALLADSAGSTWSWVWVAGVALAAAAPLGLFRHRRIRRTGGSRPDHRARRAAAQYLAGIAIAAIVLAPAVLDVMVSPEAFAQTYDNVFHLNATHLIVSTGEASPFGLGLLGVASFYPVGWYNWAALLMELTGISVTVAFQACTLVTIFGVWPIGLAWLAETCIRPGTFGRLVAGPLALSSVSFPFSLLDWGTLYSNLLGFALMPAVVAAGWEALGRRRPPQLSLAEAIGLLMATAAGAAFAHPNAALGAAVFLMPAAILAAWRALVPNGLAPDQPAGGTRQRLVRDSRPWTWAVIAGAVGFPVIWLTAAGSISDSRREAFLSVPRVLGEILLGTSLGKPLVATLSIGLVLGLVQLARRRELRIVLVTFALLSITYLATATFESHLATSFFAAPFYNDPYRASALVAVATIPIAILGWDWLTTSVYSWLTSSSHEREEATRVATTAERPRQRREALAAGGLAAALALLILPTPGWADTTARLRDTFTMDDESDVLTPDEYTLIVRLPQTTPSDTVIAADPWQGASLAFAFADRAVTQYYMRLIANENVALINESLNTAAHDPAVCDAIRAEGAEYALELEPHPIKSVREPPDNPGLEGLGEAEGFELVDSEGRSALYRITACE
ncbi:MAG TPA: DUF6541 family protein [Actinomycetaceae bacterium]|nr:DUF6541 family protein [Actinomycetaceae bacterium]